jgi:hypothetical protein
MPRLTLMLSFFIACFQLKANTVHPNQLLAKRILIVKLSENGMIVIGRDTISSDKLALYIQDRLFKGYRGTGNMHKQIVLEKTSGNVPDAISASVVTEIKEGQRRALIDLSLQIFEKTYEHISSRKQRKLQRKYPVLFQTSFG